MKFKEQRIETNHLINNEIFIFLSKNHSVFLLWFFLLESVILA